MTWARFDDRWPEVLDIESLSLAARWHLVRLILRCAAGIDRERPDADHGRLSSTTAARCSDVDDPDAVMAELAAAGHIEYIDDRTVRIVRIDDHIPSASVLRGSAERMRRHRAHNAGTHELCPQGCGGSDASRDAHSDAHSDVTSSVNPGGVTRHVTRTVWTGRGHPLDSSTPLSPAATPHPAAIPRLARVLLRGVPETGSTTRGKLRQRLVSDQRHLIDDAIAHATAQGWLAADPDGRIRRGAIPA